MLLENDASRFITVLVGQASAGAGGGPKVQVRGRQFCRAGSWPWVEQTEDLPESVRKSSRPRQQRLKVTKLVERIPNLTEQARDGSGAVVEVEEGKTWLPAPPNVSRPRAVHNAASLAYLGDAIYEMFVRRHFLTPPQSIEMYNNRVQALACCEAQDALLKKLVKGNFLSDEEQDVLRWGRNVKMGHKRATRRAGTAVYNSASSLETLIGYLYLKDPPRLERLMSTLGLNGEQTSGQIVDSDLGLQ